MDSKSNFPDLKLFMLLLGARVKGRHVEQHDFFFAIAPSLKDLVPEIKTFWPTGGGKVHVDGYREVTAVDGYRVSVVRREGEQPSPEGKKLFFINLGGYQENKFEEQHYVLLTVKDDRAAAFREAKETLFYKNNWFEGAKSHIDDKYGIDVDDLYEIDEILPAGQKAEYSIKLSPEQGLAEDQLYLGYFPLDSL